jgi:hypothetical protein
VAAERHSGPLANDRRPTAEALKQFVAAEFVISAASVLVVPATAIENEGLRRSGVKLWRDARALAS